MKKLRSFIQKELYHIFRDPRTMIILFGIPIAQLLIFGYVIRSEIRNVNIAVLDHAKDEMSIRITNKMVSSDYFILKEYLDNETQIEDILRKGTIKEVIVFNADFSQQLEREGKAALQLIADASDPNNARMIVSYSKAIINSFIKNEFPEFKMSLKIDLEARMFFNEELRSVNLFVPGIIALILMLISAMMTSISITREKELGTMEILLVSPLHPLQIMLGKVIPYLGLSFINAVIIMLMGYFVFGVPIRGNIILLLAESMLFILMALSLGIFISTVSKNQMIAMFISMIGLMLPTILLTGLIFPIENMPKILQWFSTLMPARWFIVIMRSIMLKGTGLFIIWKETLILLAMCFFFIFISVKKFKIRLA